MERGFMEKPEEGSQFIEFVQVLREKCGYTVRQLCEGICSSGTVDSLEKGRWSPNQLL